MEIPYRQLSDGALRGLIEDFVTREGTDTGHAEYDLDEKVRAVMDQLARGEIRVTFDAETESCGLAPVR